MPTYTYEREFDDAIHTDPGAWNVDHVGEPQNLADRITAILSGKNFVLRCDGEVVDFVFEESLTQNDLDTLVSELAAHKLVVDWPPA